MNDESLTSFLQLRAELDSANERIRVLIQRADRVQRENEEISARNNALERSNEQLRFSMASMANRYQSDD